MLPSTLSAIMTAFLTVAVVISSNDFGVRFFRTTVSHKHPRLFPYLFFDVVDINSVVSKIQVVYRAGCAMP